jgi:hypothetical protein
MDLKSGFRHGPVESNDKRPTCMFSRCLGNTAKLILAVSDERSESDVIYKLSCAEYLAGRFVKRNLGRPREDT